MAKIYIGCCGWNYKHWRGRFYPEKLPVKQWFSHYAKFFETVELNNTFYRLPLPSTVRSWESQAPNGFAFAVKASRYLTHMIKLKNAEGPLETFLDNVTLLKDHLGPILFQLPPGFQCQYQRLESFLNLLPLNLRYVFEFRNQSWMNEDVFKLLDSRDISFCTHDMPGLDVPRRSVGLFTYVRLHGGDKKYSGNYPDEALLDWWRWMQTQLVSGKDLYVYFNNDGNAHAVYNALRLKELAGFKKQAVYTGRLWHNGEPLA